MGSRDRTQAGRTKPPTVTLVLSVTRLGYVLRRAGYPLSIRDSNKALSKCT